MADEVSPRPSPRPVARPYPSGAHPDKPQPARFTADEFERLAWSGLLRDRKVELRGGVIWDMNATYTLHAMTTLKIARRLDDALPPGSGLAVGVDASIRYGAFYPTADVVVFAPGDLRGPVLPEQVRLIVEIADTSLDDDLGDKKARYEAEGAPEYWVVDVAGRRILRFAFTDGRNAEHTPVAFGEPAASLTLPGLAIATADLPTP